jgi:transposase
MDPTSSDLNSFSDDPVILKEMVAELIRRLAERDRKIDSLIHQLERFRRNAFGRRAETVDPDQLLLAVKELLAETDEPETAPEPARDDSLVGSLPKDDKTRRKGHGRRKLPNHLKRERKEYCQVSPEGSHALSRHR